MTRRLRLRDAPDALSVKECAQVLGVSCDVIYECVQRDEIRALRLGRRIVVPRAELQRVLRMTDNNGADYKATGGTSWAARRGERS